MRRFLIVFFVLMVCPLVSRAETIPEDVACHCILGEARGEYAKHGYNALLAVADALRNRGTTRGVYGCKVKFSDSDESFMRAKKYYEVALRAWRESTQTNLVKGADHWESTDFKVPYWAKGKELTYQIGKHVFYK